MKKNEIDWPSWPQYGQEEYDAVQRVIKSDQLFADKEVREFEQKYAEYIGSKYVLGIGNATQGLHLSLAALNIGVGDEVIVTPYSFISSASCVLMQNAVPIFCDIEKESLGLCPKDIKKKITERTKAIIVVHMFGYPAKITQIAEIAKKYNLFLIEDASHSHGAKSNNVNIGNFGDISAFSLHQRKVLSVGDGGIVCMKNKEHYEKIHKMRSFGHHELSYNYRMTEFAGALGKVQLEKLDIQNKIRRDNFKILSEILKNNSNLVVRSCRKHDYGVYYAIEIEILSDDLENIKSKVKILQDIGVSIRVTFVQPPLNKHPHFNPKVTPARGLPWEHPHYNGLMKNRYYKDLDLPNANKYCSPRILELYVHPPVNKDLVEKVGYELNRLFH